MNRKRQKSEAILDVEGAALLLGVSKYTVYRLIARDKLPATKIGRQWRFHRPTLIQWVATGSSATQLEGILKRKWSFYCCQWGLIWWFYFWRLDILCHFIGGFIAVGGGSFIAADNTQTTKPCSRAGPSLGGLFLLSAPWARAFSRRRRRLSSYSSQDM